MTAIIVLTGLLAALIALMFGRRIVERGRALYSGDDSVQDDEPVPFLTFSGELEAEVARGKLAAHGIPSMIVNTNSLAFYGPTPIANWELRVRFDDVEEARRVLELSEESARAEESIATSDASGPRRPIS